MPWRSCVSPGLKANRMLSKDFKEFVGLLNAHGVDYLVVGGFAMALHGRPRYTGDLDLWVGCDAENANRLINALREFGFGEVGLSAQDFMHPEQVVQLGYPPFRIDLLTSIDGVEFIEALRHREEIEHDGLRIAFINLHDLKANKRASGRPRDIDDLENLP